MVATATKVTFPFNPLLERLRVDQSTIRRVEFQHEILVLDVYGIRGKNLPIRVGDPMSALMSGGRQPSLSFVGYVHKVTETSQRTHGTRKHRIICVGPTWPMKDSEPHVYIAATASEIVREICLRYRLTADVEDHSLRLPTVVQSNESDWALMVRLARQIGYVLYATGTTVHFHSRRRFEQERRAAAPRFVARDLMQSANATVHEFSGRFAEDEDHGEGGKSERRLGGLDLRTGNAFGLNSTALAKQPSRRTATRGLWTRTENAMASRDYSEADARVAGAQERAAWAYRAEALVDGRSRFAPSSMAYLDGLDNEYEGFWTTIGVEHIYKYRRPYQMRLTLGTDSLGEPLVPRKPSIDPIDSPALLNAPVDGKPLLMVPGGQAEAQFIQTRGEVSGTFVWVSDRSDAAPPQPETRVSDTLVRRRRRASNSGCY